MIWCGMARRLIPIRRKVDLWHDGARIEAEEGEPIAFALLAADKVALTRGPKLHRPRGPSCLRGGCDGCALRVDGEPNVLTCLVPARGGEVISSQNVLGSREIDLLQVTDWFFPHGFDHHHFLAGVPAASPVMQKLARHVAGLGRIPDSAAPPGQGNREEVDVLIVGGGPAGLRVARRLIEQQPRLRLLIVDDGIALGGSLRARRAPVQPTAELGYRVRTQTTAAGIYEREVLLASGNRATIVQARAIVLATGTHDGTLPFANNDLPGVMSARAGALLAASGIAVGDRVGLLGSGPYVDSFVAAVGDQVVTLPLSEPLAAQGRARLRGVAVAETERHRLDALLVETHGAPSFELAQQAGATLTYDPERGGYLPSLDERGRALSWLWCAGELAGTGASLPAIERQAERVAADVLCAL